MRQFLLEWVWMEKNWGTLFTAWINIYFNCKIMIAWNEKKEKHKFWGTRIGEWPNEACTSVDSCWLLRALSITFGRLFWATVGRWWGPEPEGMVTQRHWMTVRGHTNIARGGGVGDREKGFTIFSIAYRLTGVFVTLLHQNAGYVIVGIY
jgi:hypothetical protein